MDPDCYSKKLYKDLAKVCSGVVNGHSFQFENSNFELKLFVDDSESECCRLGSDFINPCSSFMKKEHDFSDETLAKWFHQGRVLGGHAVFCRHENSINQKKSGKPTYDRFDLCLDEIHDFFLNNGKGKHSNGLRNAIKDDKEFFALFGEGEEGFQNYVKFFKLTDFVDKDYNVISLAWSVITEDQNEDEILLIDDEYKYINELKNKTELKKYYTYLPSRNIYAKVKKELTSEEEKAYAITYANNVVTLIKRRNDKMYLDLIK